MLVADCDPNNPPPVADCVVDPKRLPPVVVPLPVPNSPPVVGCAVAGFPNILLPLLCAGVPVPNNPPVDGWVVPVVVLPNKPPPVFD